MRSTIALVAATIMLIAALAISAGCAGSGADQHPYAGEQTGETVLLTPPTVQRTEEAAPTSLPATQTPTRAPALPGPMATQTPTAVPEAPDSTPTPVPAQAVPLVALALDDLKTRLGPASEEVVVTAVESVEWRDASLGCPQPGMLYAQVITPGYRIVLAAAGREYVYHTDRGQKVVLCEGQPGTSQVPAADQGLPLYVQVVQTFLMPGASPTVTSGDPPPNNVFAYDSTSRTLLLRPSVSLSPEAQVLVGWTTVIQGTSSRQVHGELHQVPPGDAGPVELLTVDTETGAVTFAYAGQTFQLYPGESRSLKRAAGQATEITIVANTGRVASIEPHLYGPGTR